MQTEEQKKEDITVSQEKKIKKVSTIVTIIIVLVTLLVTIDIILVTKVNIGPFLAIRTTVYKDGGTKVYYGLGYKVIKYNQVIGRRDTELGLWNLKYNTTPIDLTIDSLTYNLENNNNYKDYYHKFIRITGTIYSVDLENKTIIVKFSDNESGKYNLTIKARLIDANADLTKFNQNSKVSILGTINDYKIISNEKTIYIINSFVEQY